MDGAWQSPGIDHPRPIPLPWYAWERHKPDLCCPVKPLTIFDGLSR